ncbi:MAG: RNA methyltransferase [Chloroflexi bacterium]|nr:RNA methyltransferase [Chloroflexota bacterium]
MSEVPGTPRRALVIASTANPRLRAAARLRERRERDRRGRILVDGVREISRALEGGLRLEEVFVPVGLDAGGGAEARDLLRALGTAGTPVVAVEPVAMRRLAFGDRDAEPVAVAVAPAATLRSIDLPANALVVVLEGVEKPGNLGAIVRSADGAGADAVVVAGGPIDPWNPNTIRASLGTVFTTPLAVATSGEVLAWLREAGLAVVAARVDGERAHTDVDLAGPLALVLGSEAAGLSDAWREVDIVAIRLPMLGRADSLNVAATAAVLLYEARRQRDVRARVPAAPGP